MPLRTITLPDGTVCTRMIQNFHPDGTEFLPEEFTIPSDTPQGKRIYAALGRLLQEAWEREQAEEAKKARENKNE